MTCASALIVKTVRTGAASDMFAPFAHACMTNAIRVAALVGRVCGFPSAHLMLKGWSLIGDALSHSVVPGDLVAALAIAGPVTVILAPRWRDFMLHACDPAQAQVSCLATGLLHHGLLAILSLTTVATLSPVGLISAIGLLIAPGAIAFLLVRSFGTVPLSPRWSASTPRWPGSAPASTSTARRHQRSSWS